jgi:hypothetical protein
VLGVGGHGISGSRDSAGRWRYQLDDGGHTSNFLAMTPLDSPALKHRTADYPVRFWNAVPKRVRMNFDVAREMFITGAMPEWRDVVAVKGQEYPVWVSSEGYIAAIINGLRLPLKSWEFEVVQWHPVNCCSACGLPSGGRELCDGCVLDARDVAKAQAEMVRRDAALIRDGEPQKNFGSSLGVLPTNDCGTNPKQVGERLIKT